MQGLLFLVLLPVGDRASSPTPRTSGPTFPPTTGGKGRGEEGGHLSLSSSTRWQVKGEARSPTCIHGARSPGTQSMGSALPLSRPWDQPFFSRGKGSLAHAATVHATGLGSSSPTLAYSEPAGTALLCYPGEVEGALSREVQLVRAKANSVQLCPHCFQC